MKKFIGMCAFLLAGTANAGLIELDWTTTVQSFDGSVPPGVVGEEITTTFTVDNGGTSILSQSWTVDDFVSYRVEGASGWWAESLFIDTQSLGQFSTDALGSVTSAGFWYVQYASATITTTWAGVLNGGWFNNGINQVVCVASTPPDCVSAVDVGENTSGSSWTASKVPSVPEPASIVLLGLGLAGLGFSRKKKIA